MKFDTKKVALARRRQRLSYEDWALRIREKTGHKIHFISLKKALERGSAHETTVQMMADTLGLEFEAIAKEEQPA